MESFTNHGCTIIQNYSSLTHRKNSITLFWQHQQTDNKFLTAATQRSDADFASCETRTKLRKPCGKSAMNSRCTGLRTCLSRRANITESSSIGSRWHAWNTSYNNTYLSLLTNQCLINYVQLQYGDSACNITEVNCTIFSLTWMH